MTLAAGQFKVRVTGQYRDVAQPQPDQFDRDDAVRGLASFKRPAGPGAAGTNDQAKSPPAYQRKLSKRTMLNRMSVTKLPAGFVPPRRSVGASNHAVVDDAAAQPSDG